MEAVKIAVIGAASVDICGKSFMPPRMKDSNPGKVSQSFGGVGRNIAGVLKNLGAEVSLIVAVGDDENGRAIYDDCVKSGLDMSLSLTLPGETSAVYLYISDEGGDMQLAVADMAIAYRLDPEYLAKILPELNACDAVVIDGNLSNKAIAFAAENIRVPLYADAVSCAKAKKLEPVFPALRAFKPNLLEAQYLTGTDSANAAADALLATGMKRVFISLGGEGMLACEGSERILVPGENVEVKSLSGCGDAAAAGVIYADLCGMSLYDAAAFANHMGALAAAGVYR